MSRGSNDVDSVGYIPPQAMEIEKAVLGAMIMEPYSVSAVSDVLRPEMFYTHAHSVVFIAIINLFRSQKGIDLMTITNELRNIGELDNPGGTTNEFINDLANTKKAYVQSKYDPTIIPTPYNGGYRAKGIYYHYKGNMYRKGDTRPVIKPNSDGNFFLGENAIKINSWKDKNGNFYKNAKIISVKKVKGKWMAVIQHDHYLVDKDKARFIAKHGQARWDADVAAGLKKNKPLRKDQVMVATENVPLDDIFNLMNRSIILKDIKYKGTVDMEGLDSVAEKVKTSNAADPMNIR